MTGSLLADTIFLRDGRILENVVSVANEGGYLIIFRDGSTLGLKQEQVQRIQVQAVLWKAPAASAQEEKPVQNELDQSAHGDRFPYSLVPGWQQYRDGRFAQSALFAGLFVGGLGAMEEARYLYRRSKDRRLSPPVILATLYLEGINRGWSGSTALIVANNDTIKLEKDLQLRNRNLEAAYLGTFTIYVLNILDAVFFSAGASARAGEQPGARFLFAFAPATGGGRTEFYLGLQAAF